MILVPISFALEFKNKIDSAVFEYLCAGLSLLHVLMFWLIYAGFIPAEFNGLIQRLWAIPTMGWFGLAIVELAKTDLIVDEIVVTEETCQEY